MHHGGVGILCILPLVQGPKLGGNDTPRCFTVSNSLVFNPGCLSALPVIRGTGGDSSDTSGPSPHLCQCCFTVTFICLNENQQISITLQMYKQLQYCGCYSINMNVLLALSIPMLFHALLACSDPGGTL